MEMASFAERQNSAAESATAGLCDCMGERHGDTSSGNDLAYLSHWAF